MKAANKNTWISLAKLMDVANVASGTEDVTELLADIRCLISVPIPWITGTVQACGAIGTSISALKVPKARVNEVIRHSILLLPPASPFQGKKNFVRLQAERSSRGMDDAVVARKKLDELLKPISKSAETRRLVTCTDIARSLAWAYIKGEDKMVVAQKLVREAEKLDGMILKAVQHFGNRPDLPIQDAAFSSCFLSLLGKEECKVTSTEVLHRLAELFQSEEKARKYTFVRLLKTGTVAATALVRNGDGNLFVLKFVFPEKKELFMKDLKLFPRLGQALKMTFTLLEQFDPKMRSVRMIVTKLVDAMSDPIVGLELAGEFDLNLEAANLEAASELMETLSNYSPSGSVVGVPRVVNASETALLMTFCNGDPLMACSG